jgi:DNA (cytosine-5)-methyltransferase 1
MTAYYNEIDPYAAQWLRNLIDAGHIARGDVDERSIIDVKPDDLRGYTQCHFFAGVGGWSVALRLAAWPDDRPVWTGSCPCQPFSAAGAGKAADDERHLWPAWFSLIKKCKPAIVLGEQVEAAIGWGWLDLVFADLEAEGYACGASVLPACSVGAPHIRNRLWFVADASSERRQQNAGRPSGDEKTDGRARRDGSKPECEPQDGRSVRVGNANGEREIQIGGIRQRPQSESDRIGEAGELGDAYSERPQRRANGSGAVPQGREVPERPAGFSGGILAADGSVVDAAGEQAGLPGRARQSGSAGFWACDWLPCTDGKARPVRPGSFPLAHGVLRRPSKLRAYGNAIVPQVAAEFIMSATHDLPQHKESA